MLANLLALQNIPITILEKDLKRKPGSRAIGITPPSLEILEKIHLLDRFLQIGVKGRIAEFHGTHFLTGSVIIHESFGRFPFVLTVPQSVTEALLEEHLKQYPWVEIRKGIECINLHRKEDKIILIFRNTRTDQVEELSAAFVCGCDGARSRIRQLLRIPFVGNWYKPTFIMGDYLDRSNLGDKALLWFTDHGTVELFPLPGQCRRWIIQTRYFMKPVPDGFLEQELFNRTQFHLNVREKTCESAFGIQRFIAHTFYQKRVFLCGMPPIPCHLSVAKV